MNGSGDLDNEDMELLATAQRESLAEDAAALAEAGETPPAAAPAAAPTPAPAAPAPAAAAPAADEGNRGDLRAALRASRHAERRLREENARLRENAPAPAAPGVPDLDETTINDLKAYAPKAAERLAALEAENEKLRKAAPAPAARTEFVPETLDDEVQELVDDIPELEAWRITPELQADWQAVKAADTFLSKTGAWRGKPMSVDRFKAAMAQVLANKPAAAPPAPAPVPPKTAARALIDALPITNPAVTVGGLRSGENPGLEIPNYHQMVKDGASDEDIMASLN